MARLVWLAYPVLLVTLVSGCVHEAKLPLIAGHAPTGEGPKARDEQKPKTLMKWIAGRPEPDDDKADEPENDKSEKDEKKNGTSEKTSAGPAPEKDSGNGNSKDSNGGQNGGERAGGGKNEDEDEIVTDRPDFTEASSTVGRGRVQLEAGYTFYSKAFGTGYVRNHTYPELLLRVGMLADWFELRVGQFWTSSVDTSGGGRVATTGAEDMYLGVKLGLVEQKRFLPEAALILQMTVPSGAPELTNSRVLPGFNLLYGWEVTERVSAGGSFGVNRIVNAIGQEHSHINVSLTTGFSLTKMLGSYFEWFTLLPVGSVAPGPQDEHYINGGITYKVTRNVQLDVRAGKGLSPAADDYFAGAGFAIRR